MNSEILMFLQNKFIEKKPINCMYWGNIMVYNYIPTSMNSHFVVDKS